MSEHRQDDDFPDDGFAGDAVDGDTSDGDDRFDDSGDGDGPREADMAVIEAGSRTLRAQVTPPAPEDDVPSRPEDPELDQRLREVEDELMGRWPETKLDPSLERMAALMDVLGQPQRSYPAIHITGTNGKTSTARMIERLLLAFELRTGRYTSPHVQSVTERISLDGTPIPAERFIEIYRDILPYIGMIDDSQPHRMSFFEVLTGMAYAAFADAPVDVAVVEVGMGGSWDATNVVDGSVAVVTPIALDHTDRLGSTPGEIAVEKGGIIKKGATAVLAQQPPDAARELLRRAVEVEATVAREGAEFGVLHREVAVGGQMLTLRGLGGEYDQVFLPLHGEHQARNASLALAAVEAFFGVGSVHQRTLDLDTVRGAFAAVTSPGRLEVVRRSPTVVLDAAHNPAGAQVTAAAISEVFGFSHLVGVVGPSGDKDVRGLLEAFEPVFAEIVVTRNSTSRAMDVDALAALAVEVFGEDRVQVEPRLDDALEAAVTLAEEEGEYSGAGVLVTGSVITVGQARLLLARR
ncbi:dihydrofolate synthase / folylpolyglutamate synthase [Actinacidiphila yanglinensis]|uniref:Dihydrofolate synthase/folylpolyglutamate synthase n=1 Tax=Actinacidiphila yanglinensis TaxID=310779 RepID=A0A1H6DM65_9ACTN|nr:folylpolyglutamate synthase/dihydrofolate synthase family protein [Actinacidiphila yanglinensis]SEG86487.1 dihydrofolate synthase / folylpolyglutamate synthase [Actinacidiphila yanglinensis]